MGGLRDVRDVRARCLLELNWETSDLACVEGVEPSTQIWQVVRESNSQRRDLEFRLGPAPNLFFIVFNPMAVRAQDDAFGDLVENTFSTSTVLD